MPTYYEIIGVESTASAPEIENKLDEYQDELRQKVTHHDPIIVADANQKMQVLEEIRSTLMDNKKRKKYDANLNYGGLGDPNVEVQPVAPFFGGALPRIPQMGQAAMQGSLERTDAWICPKDKHANAVGEKFCAKCSTQIGANCPKCGKVAELTKKFCSNCGTNKVEHFETLQAQKVREIKGQKDRLENEIGKLAQVASGGIVTNRTLKGLGLPIAQRSSMAGVLSGLAIISICMGMVIEDLQGLFVLIFLGAIGGAIVMGFSDAKASLEKHIERLSLNRESLNKRIVEEDNKKYGDSVDEINELK